MSRTYLQRLIGLVVALIVLAQIGIIVSSLSHTRQLIERDETSRLQLGAEIAEERIIGQGERLLVGAVEISRDANFIRAVKTRNNNGVVAVLDRSLAQSGATYAFVLNADGRLIATRHPVTASQAIPLANSVREFGKDIAGEPRFAVFGGQMFQLVMQPLASDGEWVVLAASLDTALAASIRETTGLDVAFWMAGKSDDRSLLTTTVPQAQRAQIAKDLAAGVFPGQRESGKTAEGFRPEIAVPLATVDGRKAAIALTGQKVVAMIPYKQQRMELVAIAFALSTLAGLILTLLLSRASRRHITDPVVAMIKGLQRMQKGDYHQPIRVNEQNILGRLARSINDMQETIASREDRIVHHAQFDALTGLTSRSVINERLKEAVARAQRSGSVVAALTIDLARFSHINAKRGYEVGDAVLKEVARRIASNIRVTDTVARVGSDEFLLVLEDMDRRLAPHIAEFLASTLESPVVLDDEKIRLNINIGIALYPHHAKTPDALRTLSTIALNTAKEDGKKVVIYERGQDEKHLRQEAIVSDLTTAIKNGELYLQYQPKVTMETQVITHVEALVRWRHPQLGPLPPDEFISLLEESGEISHLTDWVLKDAIRQISDWKEQGFELGVAVNLSAKDLMIEGLPDRVNALLRHYVVDPGSLTLEVTEYAVMRDTERAIAVLGSLRKLGVRLSLDDFGTGHSSLALLKKLPLDELKIDKSFVLNLRADSGDAVIVKSTIDLGHNMGLLVVAEGVEGQKGWNILKSYGCDLVQGYLVSPPISPRELIHLLIRQQAKHMHKLDFDFLDQKAG